MKENVTPTHAALQPEKKSTKKEKNSVFYGTSHPCFFQQSPLELFCSQTPTVSLLLKD